MTFVLISAGRVRRASVWNWHPAMIGDHRSVSNLCSFESYFSTSQGQNVPNHCSYRMLIDATLIPEKKKKKTQTPEKTDSAG